MKINKYKIYIIKNSINNKVYIGQTTMKLERRLYNHCISSTSLGKDIQKYGKNNFFISLLDDSASNMDELTDIEEYYINKYNSISDGYNSRHSSKSCFKNKPHKSSIAITIDEELYSKLEELSNEEDRTISGQINKILKDYFKEKEN